MGFSHFSMGFSHFSMGFSHFSMDFPIFPMDFKAIPPLKSAPGGSLRGSGEAAGAAATAWCAALQLCVSGHRGRSTLQARHGWDAGDGLRWAECDGLMGGLFGFKMA